MDSRTKRVAVRYLKANARFSWSWISQLFPAETAADRRQLPALVPWPRGQAWPGEPTRVAAGEAQQSALRPSASHTRYEWLLFEVSESMKDAGQSYVNQLLSPTECSSCRVAAYTLRSILDIDLATGS